LSPDSSEAKNTALSNDGVKPAFDEEPCVPIQMAAKVALKHGRDPSSNLGRGALFLLLEYVHQVKEACLLEFLYFHAFYVYDGAQQAER
jgi:hypothetical protein